MTGPLFHRHAAYLHFGAHTSKLRTVSRATTRASARPAAIPSVPLLSSGVAVTGGTERGEWTTGNEDCQCAGWILSSEWAYQPPLA